MKLVTVSGPRGAGKEEIVKRLVRTFPGGLYRVVPHTTRIPRDGEVNGREYHFVSKDEFERMVGRGEFVFTMEIRSQRSGTTRAEFFKKPLVVIDITPSGARHLREFVVEEGGSVFTVFIHASRAERKGRIARRQPDLPEGQIEELLDDEPAPSEPARYLDFDLVIQNADGQLEIVASCIVAAVRDFLGVEVTAVAV